MTHSFPTLRSSDLIEEMFFVRGGQLLVDQSERFEVEARAKRELDERPALELRRMLERASVIDHDNTRAGTAQRRAELLQGYRFARPGLAEDCDIMVARRIFERTPEKWLAAPADQHEMGHLPTQKLALDGCEVR